MSHELDCAAFCPDSCNADHTHFDENDCDCHGHTTTTEKQGWEERFDKEFEGSRVTARDELVKRAKSFISKEIENAKREVVEFIRAEGEWVKEDVHDGNYGYFRADDKLLEAALQGEVTGE